LIDSLLVRRIVANVVNVASDDTLNARSGPGTEFPIAFEFAADANGIVTFGVPSTSADSATWVEVYNPIAGLATTSAWVNASFLESVIVPDDGPCLFNGPQDHYIGSDWRSSDTASEESDAVVVDQITTYRFGACLRTVIELGSEFAPVADKTPAIGLPDDIVVTRGSPTVIDFGSSIVAAQIDASESRLDLGDGRTLSVFMISQGDGTMRAELYGPSDLVDSSMCGLTPPNRRSSSTSRTWEPTEPMSVEQHRSLMTRASSSPTQSPTATASQSPVSPGPSRQTLDFSLRNADGPIEAMFFDTIAPDGEVLSSGAVMTTGWTEAWGRGRVLDGTRPRRHRRSDPRLRPLRRRSRRPDYHLGPPHCHLIASNSHENRPPGGLIRLDLGWRRGEVRARLRGCGSAC